MLLQSYKITRILPCLARYPEKIRVIAEVSGEIYEAFPYLNAILKGCIYNHPALTHSAAPRLRRELSQMLRPSGRWGKRRSGSTLSKPRHLCWGAEGLTLTIKKDGKLFTLHALHNYINKNR